MTSLPSGTVTFLFTDIEGSTRLLRAAGDEYASLLEMHRTIVRDAVARYDGHEVGTEGDSFFVSFGRASDAVHAAADAQRALCAHTWPDGREVRVRMGLHTGEASVVGGEYVGLSVHQAHRVSAAAHGRQVLVSSTTADLVRDAMPPGCTLRDAGVVRLKDIEQPQQLYQLSHHDLPDDFPASASMAALPTNLPVQVTSFVGRKAVLAEASRLLSASRLLTLTGAGGVGKTRLAIELAAGVIGDYPDGVWMADLAPVAEPGLVAQAIAEAIGLVEQQGDGRPWVERVIEHLREESTLLLLDNCEHLVGACADVVAHVLPSCPRLRVVVTTREPLGIEGETAWRVPSLSVPEADSDDAGSSEAVGLFIARAREVSPGFEPSADDVRAIADICRNLDGIPLAIELAAARTQALSVAQILERLDDRFRLLRGSGRRRIERQQTLRAAVDWSFNLLSDPERTVLRRASVFAGGFTLTTAEAVCAGEGIDEVDVLELLESLVRKSLVVFDTSARAAPRYRMLETIRQYALEKLLESGEGPDVRTRHRDVFLALAEDAEDAMMSGNDVVAYDRVEEEFDNIRAAIEWLPAGDDGRTALRLCGSLHLFFASRGHLGEGLRRCKLALEADTGPPSEDRLKVLFGAQLCAFHHGDTEDSERLTEEGMALIAQVPESPASATARAGILVGAGVGAALRGDLRAGIGLCERAVEVARRANDAYSTGFCLYNLGILVHNRADFDAALALWEEAARIAPPGWSAAANHVIAREWLRRGDIAKARGLVEHGLRLAREYRFPIPTMWTLHALTDIAMAGGDYALARASAEEHVAIARRIGERLQGQGLGLAKMAAADAALGDLDGAAASIAEAAAIFEELDARAWAGEARFALGLVQDASGDADAARASYAAAAELCRAVGHEPCAAACEAALAGGSAADATGFMLSDWPRWIAAPA